MKVSKTLFMHFMRCDRFAGLYETYQNKIDAIVDFHGGDELEALMSIENKAKTSALLDSIENEYGDDDPIHHISEQMEVMMPYYAELENIAGKVISNTFKGDVIYSLETKKQKRMALQHEGYEFYAFLDAFQEDDETVRLIEVKATTDKKYLDLVYTNKQKEKFPVFEKDMQGILIGKLLPFDERTKTYHTQYANLNNRFTKVGRYMYDIAYQYAIHKKKFPTLKKEVKAYLAVLNSKYRFDGTYVSGKPQYQDDLITFIDVTNFVEDMLPTMYQDMNKVVQRLNANFAGNVPLGPHCQRKDNRECPFFDICHQHFPKKHDVFSYINRQHGFSNGSEKVDLYDWINEGKVHMTDIPFEYLNREDNRIQRQVVESNQAYINKKRIQSFIEDLKYPIYHLDFESFPCPLPRYRGEKPYMQSLFQFSVHVQKEPNDCDLIQDHTQYLADSHDDHRKRLAEYLCDVIKDDDGSVMVYHEQFEKDRLEELAELFPEYAGRLLNIQSRIVDLKLFLKGNAKIHEALGFDETKGFNFYDASMDGSFSIKKILPIFTNISYQDLDVQNGTEALTQFAKMPMLTKKEQATIYENLTAYCRQDTYAMFKILEGLRKRVYET